MKKQLLLFILMLLPLVASAASVEIDGVYYNLISKAKQAEVTSSYYSGTITIPESVEYNDITYKVTSIGDQAFYGCRGLTSVTIPNSVTSIGTYAFYLCSGLTSITIPNSVTSIGTYAFDGCDGLTSIEIPNSVTSIGERAFGGTPWYNNQPVGLVYAGKVVYKYKGTMPDNTNITIKEGSLGIAGEAFSRCSGLTSIEIPNSVTSIGYRAFYDCSGLTSITIGNGVMSIGDDAFSGCEKLQKVIVSDIAAWCGISFGNSDSNPVYRVHHLYNKNGTEIKDLVIPDGVTSIGYRAFGSCSGLTSVTIGNSVTRIGDYAFHFCSGLTSVTIPNSVTSIGYSAFYGCSGLTSITIGENVTSIGANAFSSCKKINDVYCYKERYPSTDKTAFDYSYPDYITLHVPAESVDPYKAVSPWNTFRNVVALTDSDPKPTDTAEHGDPIIGDIDGDGVVDVNDVQRLINIILKK